MAIIECGRGHLYDTDQYASCPYCNSNSNVIDFNASSYFGGVGKTAPVAGGFGPSQGSHMSGEVSGNYASYEGVGATVAPQSYIQRHQEDNKTVGILKKSLDTRDDIEPVVGWLVCIEGEEKGKEYRLLPKNNTIGRSENMDVCIKGDKTISRENHARLAYDKKHNDFHLIPAESTNNIYLNDEPIYVPAKLNAYDCIELGDSKMLFVPFCSDLFDWSNGLKEKEE